MNHSLSALFFFSFLPGIIVLILGLKKKFSAPAYPGISSGQQVDLNMKNADTWKESQEYAAKVMIWVGIVNLVLWPLALHLFWDGFYSLTLMSWLTFVVLTISLSVGLPDGRLHRLFDSSGNRKEAH